MSLYRMTLDDEFGEPYYEAITADDVDRAIRKAIDALTVLDDGLHPTEEVLRALWLGIPAVLAALEGETDG